MKNPIAARHFTRIPWFLGLAVMTSGLTPASAQTTNAHWFNGITALPDRTMRLEFGGNVGGAFRIYFDMCLLEVSSDLVTWAPCADLVRTNTPITALSYVDGACSELFQRFYRMPSDVLATPFPKPPSGSFRAGTCTVKLSDPSRTNRYNIETNSSFMATFWYPAQAVAGQLPGPYQDWKLASYRPYWSTLTNAVPYFVSQAFPGAPIAPGTNRYPIVIYSHGLADGLSEGGTAAGVRTENTAAAMELASQGYIVVAVDHIDCYGSVFPDSTRVLRGFSFGNVLGNAGLYLKSRFNDLDFVLGQLQQMNQTDPILANRLDLDQIGIMGWSFGGGTAAEACRTNSQIKAAVLLDAYLDPVPKVTSLGVQKPFLAMCSPSSGLAPANQTLFARATNNAYILQIQNAAHETFTDQAWITQHTPATRRAGEAKNACLVSFFNKIFKNQDDHLLDAPAKTYSNITAFQRKP